MHALLARVADDAARAPSDAYGKLLERCPFRKHELEPQLLLRVGAEAHAGLPHLAQSLWTQPRERDQPLQRQQGLVGRDVGGGLLATDVLLAGLQRQDIAAFAVRVGCLADDPARHPADELGARSEEAVVRAAVALVVARALPLADRKRAAVVARRFEHAE